MADEQDNQNLEPAPEPITPENPAQDAPAEEVFFDGHPSHWMYFGKYFLSVLMVAATIALWIWLRNQMSYGMLAVILAPLLVAVYVLSKVWLDRLSIRLVVTSRTISYEVGLVGRKTVDLPLRAVSEILVEQSTMERLMGIGAISFSTDSTTDLEIRSPGIPHPDRIREFIKDHQE